MKTSLKYALVALVFAALVCIIVHLVNLSGCSFPPDRLTWGGAR
jgi:hypothetical protein